MLQKQELNSSLEISIIKRLEFSRCCTIQMMKQAYSLENIKISVIGIYIFFQEMLNVHSWHFLVQVKNP